MINFQRNRSVSLLEFFFEFSSRRFFFVFLTLPMTRRVQFRRLLGVFDVVKRMSGVTGVQMPEMVCSIPAIDHIFYVL